MGVVHCSNKIKGVFLNMSESLKKDKSYKRIVALDILRAIALIMICCYHWFLYNGTYIGVVVFFVLSGYLYTNKQLSNENLKDVWSGIKRRISKIYPSLLLVILVSTLCVYFINGGLELKYKYSVLASVLGLNNIYQIISKMSYFDNFGMLMPLTHIWALSFQFQMYLIIPFFILFLKKLKTNKKGISAIFFVLSLISFGIMAYLYSKGSDFSRIYYGTDTRIFSFLIAAAIGIFYSDREIVLKNEKLIIRILGILGLVILVVFCIFINYQSALNYYGLMYLESFLLSFSVLQLSKIEGNFFENNLVKKITSPIVKLGQHQYQYYLWQYPIMIFFREIFKWSKLGNNPKFLLQLAVLIVISEISYIFFEKMQWNFDVKKLDLKKRQKNYDLIKTTSFSILGAILGIVATSKIYENEDLKEMKSINKIQSQSQIQQTSPQQNSKIIVSNDNLSPEQDVVQQEKILQSLPNDKREILFVGDSVLDMTKEDLRKKYPNATIDTKVGRQFYEFPKLLSNYIESGKMKNTIVIALGTNGTIYKKDIKKVLEMLKGKEVYMVNTVMPDPWEREVNEEIAKAVKENPNIKMVDWYSYSKGKRQYFYKDGTHPKPHASKRYVGLLYSVVSKNIKN